MDDLNTLHIIASDLQNRMSGNKQLQHWKYDTNDKSRHLPNDLGIRRRTE